MGNLYIGLTQQTQRLARVTYYIALTSLATKSPKRSLGASDEKIRVPSVIFSSYSKKGRSSPNRSQDPKLNEQTQTISTGITKSHLRFSHPNLVI